MWFRLCPSQRMVVGAIRPVAQTVVGPRPNLAPGCKHGKQGTEQASFTPAPLNASQKRYTIPASRRLPTVAQSSMLHIRVDDETKAQASEA